jgi:hypothetical protein
MERLVEYWWNATWAKLRRRNLWLHEVDGSWRVSWRMGTSEAPIRSEIVATEAEARAALKALRETSGDGVRWKDITETMRPRDVSGTSQTAGPEAD